MRNFTLHSGENELGFLDCRYSNDYGETWIDHAYLPMTYQPGKV